jgi:hypothetical protein
MYFKILSFSYVSYPTMKSEKQLFLGDKNRGYNSKSP